MNLLIIFLDKLFSLENGPKKNAHYSFPWAWNDVLKIASYVQPKIQNRKWQMSSKSFYV